MDLGLIPSVSKVSARLPQAFLGNPLRLQMEGLGPGAVPGAARGPPHLSERWAPGGGALVRAAVLRSWSAHGLLQPGHLRGRERTRLYPRKVAHTWRCSCGLF